MKGRREKLFGDLVRVEEQQRAGEIEASRTLARRAALVAQLEQIYSELDAERRATRASPRDARLSTSDSLSVDLSRNFGRRRALSRVSLECARGEIVGLLGPNGAGKSTLLSIASTLLTPSSGEIRYGGRTVHQAGSSVAGTARVSFSRPAPVPELTARENLAFFARLYGVSDMPARVARALECAGLEARGDDQVSAFRGACGSDWRWSGRCCTSRGSCCSTSRSRDSTMRLRGAGRAFEGSAGRRGHHSAGDARSRCGRSGCSDRAAAAARGRLVAIETGDRGVVAKVFARIFMSGWRTG